MKPQIYIYVTSGGVTEWVVTRGQVDVVFADWDDTFDDREIGDLEGLIERLKAIANPKLRAQEVASAQEEIDKLRLYEEADRLREAEVKSERIAEAQALLKKEGLL